jgi:uncharacterized protein (TIGR02594 family)
MDGQATAAKTEEVGIASETTYRVMANALNVRKAPTTSSEVIGLLRKDQVVQAFSESADGKWILVVLEGEAGWTSKKHLLRLPAYPEGNEDFAWMPVATSERGVSELPGRENNLRVLDYLRSTKNLGELAISRDETAWCSAFVNWCVEKAGYVGTRSALARSWLKWGRSIEKPRKGCIAVFSRAGGFGHVGFYVGETATDILVLGGNQQNPETQKYEVSVGRYPKSRLLGFRLP